MPDMTPAEATQKMEEFTKRFGFPKEGECILMSTEATQLAMVTGAAWCDTHMVLLADRPYFRPQDIPSPYMNPASLSEEKELNLKQDIWQAGDSIKIVAVVMYTALQEGMEVVSKAAAQYKNTDFKLVVLTPVQSKLHEGAQMLADRVRCKADSVSLVNRPLSVSGGGHLHAWIYESTNATRTNPFTTAPTKKIVNALPPGQDPMNIFTPIPKQGSKIAVCVTNKEVQEAVTDLKVSQDVVAVSPGPHPTLTSWLILPPPLQKKCWTNSSSNGTPANAMPMSLSTYIKENSMCVNQWLRST